jgi:branched-chain amino acid transport system ATP-binding protein
VEAFVEDIFERIVSINERGTTILMAEQNARRALKDSDRGVVLVMGEKRLEGPAREVMDSDRLQDLFLGETA